MTARTFALSDGRSLVLDSLATSFDYSIERPFTVLMPAFNTDDVKQAEKIANALIEQGCVEFCCVGPEAEKLHDLLDYIVEDMGALDVVTTWDEDDSHACEYFLFTAGGGTSPCLFIAQPHLVAIRAYMKYTMLA